jgi:antitoxin (DNA-binding transcriptional repressor) of toxin-antitoxin stability system
LRGNGSRARRYNPCVAKIDASRIPSDALSELQAGHAVPLVKRGRTIATLVARRARPRVDAKRELAAIRAADRGDDWADYAAWPVR